MEIYILDDRIWKEMGIETLSTPESAPIVKKRWGADVLFTHFEASKETSTLFFSPSQDALVTPSTLFAAFSMVVLHIPQLPRTPKVMWLIVACSTFSDDVVFSSWLKALVKLIVAIATLKIIFLTFN